MKRLHIGLVLSLVLALGGCAANQERAAQDQAHLAAVHAAAGKPVGSFNFFVSTLYSWEPLGQHEVLVYTRPDRAWLLDVGICPELPYALAIGITSHVGQVSSGIDSVVVGNGNFPCYIQKIRPVDVARLKQHSVPRTGGKMMPESSKAAGAHK